MEKPGRFLEAGRAQPATYDRALFAAKLSEAGADRESASYLTHRLTARFDDEALYAALSALGGQRVTRHGGRHTDVLARRIAACNYEVVFSPESELSERVLWPYAPSESHGMEDARFVRFVDDAGAVTYFGTYTAFDGSQVEPQLIETQDFTHFRIGQLAGPAARNKGMALFPRKVDGQFVALSRWDRESSAIATSGDGRVWSAPTTLQSPHQPWEIIQLGNAGSPIETARGWLVLTHGCGPMRQYALGAILLDLDEPARVIGALREPLLSPLPDERNGYVPNVLYSCGALPYGDEILVPYGVSWTRRSVLLSWTCRCCSTASSPTGPRGRRRARLGRTPRPPLRGGPENRIDRLQRPAVHQTEVGDGVVGDGRDLEEHEVAERRGQMASELGRRVVETPLGRSHGLDVEIGDDTADREGRDPRPLCRRPRRPGRRRCRAGD